MVGSGRPEAAEHFRRKTGYDGVLVLDPSLGAFQAARLRRGVRRMLDPRAIGRAVRALVGGFMAGAIRGDPLQQGGTFVLGPGDRVNLAWRDRFSGDHPRIDQVLSAIPSRSR